jgi:hypothetical protein
MHPRRYLRVGPFCVMAFIGVLAASGAAQDGATPDLTTRKMRLRGGGPDPNVTAGTEVNVRPTPPTVPPPAPSPTKPGGAPALCSVTFENDTDLITKTYVDGRYAGTIRSRSELSASISPGMAVLYARAEFDDGSADAWGPVRVTCRTKYRWRLAE